MIAVFREKYINNHMNENSGSCFLGSNLKPECDSFLLPKPAFLDNDCFQT